MGVSQAIQSLASAFSNSQLFLRGTSGFEDRNRSYLSALESDITPAAIFQPRSKEEVSNFIQIIKPFSSTGEVAFAIRGGGQQPAPGCANIEDGITLDLGLLKGVEIKDEIVKIAAGERWGTVFDVLDGKGLGVAGGRSSNGGIGGLALEGGLSFFSSREGFVCDNVINYEVVLANGTTINANADNNSDLWLALKGGANNFGVVTRYDMKTFPQGPFWGGSVYYFAPSFPSQIDALVNEIQKPNATKETHLMISIGFAAQFGPQAMCQNQLYYTQEVEKPAVLEPFVSISPQIDALNSMRMLGLKEAASEQASDAMGQKRCSYMNTVVKADIATLQAAAETYTSSVSSVAELEGLVCSLTLQPYALSLLNKSASLGGNSLGLDPADGPLVSILLLTYWSNKQDDEKIFAVMRDVLDNIVKDSETRGTDVPFKFMNYASNFQDPIGSYGKENKMKLQDVSRKYDPEGMFQNGVPGGFKLFT